MGSGGHMPRPYPPSEEIDPQATRSLFVGNIPKNISVFQLRDIFQRYGDVLVSCVCVCVCVCACVVCVYTCVGLCVCIDGVRVVLNHFWAPAQLFNAPSQYGKWESLAGIFSHVSVVREERMLELCVHRDNKERC